MEATLVLLPVDGIGPEVLEAAATVLRAVARYFGHTFHLQEHLIGGAALEAQGTPLPPETLQACLQADAVLLGAVGGPAWEDAEPERRPERGLLQLRKAMGVYANLRPVRVFTPLVHTSPLKAEVVQGTDFVVVRELTGGIYFGPRQEPHEGKAYDTMVYTEEEVARVARVAARLALGRRRHLTSVDKANVLASSRLWRQVVSRVIEAEFPQVTLEHVLVDAMAMHLLRRPTTFDVVLTPNLFGDILTDEAAALAGSLGMLPSASLGDARNTHGFPRGLYEPVHGSAPDIAGQGIANPLGAILSAALLLRHSLGLEQEAQAVERAVERALQHGYRTLDLAVEEEPVNTREMTRAVLRYLGPEP